LINIVESILSALVSQVSSLSGQNISLAPVMIAVLSLNNVINTLIGTVTNLSNMLGGLAGNQSAILMNLILAVNSLIGMVTSLLIQLIGLGGLI
jgi:hypothetical protein